VSDFTGRPFDGRRQCFSKGKLGWLHPEHDDFALWASPKYVIYNHAQWQRMRAKCDAREVGRIEQLNATRLRSDICGVNHQQVTWIDTSDWAGAVFGRGGTNEHVKVLGTLRIRLDQFCYPQRYRIVTAKLGAYGK